MPELTMPEFMKEEGTAAKVRQSLAVYNIEDFCHGVMPNTGICLSCRGMLYR